MATLTHACLRLTDAERAARKAARARLHMIRSAARLLRRDDYRRRATGAGIYEYADDPKLARIVDGLIGNPAIRHIEIPARAFRAYCAGVEV